MKKIILSIGLTIVSSITFSQNTFPSSGNVGLGTTSPNYLLDLVGTSGSYSSTAKLNASFMQDRTNYRGVLLGYDNSGQIGIIGSSSINATPSNLAFWNFSATKDWFEAMRLTSDGYLGIGTSSPNLTLDVRGGIRFSGTAANMDNRSGADPLAFLANSGAVTIGWNRTGGQGETDIISNQGPGSSGGFAFYNHDNNNNETQLMWLLGNGNLLIGKSTQANSTYKLDVAGNIRANQLVVNTSGADFVFAPSYKLMSLKEVSNYININHHLPQISSAIEMQNNGLDVGNNQIKLLQKIEELTLYLIEKDKQLQTQNIELNTQKKINAGLEQRIRQIENKLKVKKKNSY